MKKQLIRTYNRSVEAINFCLPFFVNRRYEARVPTIASKRMPG